MPQTMLCYFYSSQTSAQKIIIISILQVRKLPVVTLLRSTVAECSPENNEVRYTPLWHMACLNINNSVCIESTKLWKSFAPKFHLSLELLRVIFVRISLSAITQLAFPFIMYLFDALHQIVYFQRSSFLRKHSSPLSLMESMRTVKLTLQKQGLNFTTHQCSMN